MQSQYTARQESTMYDNARHCTTRQYRTAQYNAMHGKAVRTTIQGPPIHDATSWHHEARQHTTTHDNTRQDRTTQHMAMQCNIQDNTTHDTVLQLRTAGGITTSHTQSIHTQHTMPVTRLFVRSHMCGTKKRTTHMRACRARRIVPCQHTEGSTGQFVDQPHCKTGLTLHRRATWSAKSACS